MHLEQNENHVDERSSKYPCCCAESDPKPDITPKKPTENKVDATEKSVFSSL